MLRRSQYSPDNIRIRRLTQCYIRICLVSSFLSHRQAIIQMRINLFSGFTISHQFQWLFTRIAIYPFDLYSITFTISVYLNSSIFSQCFLLFALFFKIKYFVIVFIAIDFIVVVIVIALFAISRHAAVYLLSFDFDIRI